MVANGKGQEVGVDCGDTFNTVVKPTTIRTILSLAVSREWTIHQLDVKNAFLHGDFQETIYIHQLMGFVDPLRPKHVCLLQRSLYGLKQAPRAWYQWFASYIISIGFVNSKSDPSLFIFHCGSEIAYFLLYVDDIILTCSSHSLGNKVIQLLSLKFSMKDLCPLSYFLGISVTRKKDAMFLCQQKYAQEIIARTNMSSCNPASTLVDTKSKLSANSGKVVDDPTFYRQIAGAL